jgi:hypothetical protein
MRTRAVFWWKHAHGFGAVLVTHADPIEDTAPATHTPVVDVHELTANVGSLHDVADSNSSSVQNEPAEQKHACTSTHAKECVS